MLSQPLRVPCGTTATHHRTELRIALVLVDGESVARAISTTRVIGRATTWALDECVRSGAWTMPETAETAEVV